MTSLSQVIVRPRAAYRPPVDRRSRTRSHPVRAFAVENIPEASDQGYEDLKLFATGWIAGLIFFGTLLA